MTRLNRWRRKSKALRRLTGLIAVGILTVPPFPVLAQRAAAATMSAASSRSIPSGERLVQQLIQEASTYGTYHEVLVATTVTGNVRETVRQTFDVDLGHHLLRQVGDDRAVRPPHTVLSDDTFERISIGYRAATRNNGGAWSCQQFRPGQVQLVGQQTYLAGLGWPRSGVDLGSTVWNGVPVWHVQATVFGSGSAGDSTPAQRADLLVARSNSTLVRETWRRSKDSADSATYSGYGAPMRIALPAPCQRQVDALAARRTVTVRLHPASGGRVRGTASLRASGGGTRITLIVSSLPANSRPAGLIHYGVCTDLTHLSASAASLPALKANAAGRARATGSVVTETGRQNVPLSALADGHHVIVIVLSNRGLVACGTIP